MYIQIYDERTRHVADGVRGILKKSAAVVVPQIENVVTAAQARGSRIPIAWKAPTLLVHRPDKDMQCASAITSATSEAIRSNYPAMSLQIRDLPASFKSTRHVLELWLPPPASTEEAAN